MLGWRAQSRLRVGRTPGDILRETGRLARAWAAVYLIGMAPVCMAALVHGIEPRIILSWGPRLAVIGVLASLPALALVVAGICVARRMRFLIVTLVIALLLAAWGAPSRQYGSGQASPAALRAALFSGRPELLAGALAGTLAWASGWVVLALLIRIRSARRAHVDAGSLRTR